MFQNCLGFGRPQKNPDGNMLIWHHLTQKDVKGFHTLQQHIRCAKAMIRQYFIAYFKGKAIFEVQWVYINHCEL